MKIRRSLTVLLFIFFSTATVFGQDFNAVVLMYHKFGEDRFPSTSVTLAQFETHLEYLKHNGYHVLPLDEIVSAFRNQSPLPEKSVAITIDDAYASVYEHAYPRMKQLNWPFTVFVATDPVDRGFGSIMTWDQMRDMKKNGVQFSNHTATHDHLIQQRTDESAGEHIARVRADIARAQQRLLEELGSAPMLFAYPYGEYNMQIARLVESMGFIAFGQHSGAMGPYSNPVTLPRFPVNEHYGDIKGLKDKLESLALPVTSIVPFDPVTTEKCPVLEISLAETAARLDELACFVGGQGRTTPQWIDPGKRFSIQAKKPLPKGRNRYTCTAPNRERTRYYWFSHQWVIMP